MTRIALFQSQHRHRPGGQCAALWSSDRRGRRRRRGNAVHAGDVGPARPRLRSARARTFATEDEDPVLAACREAAREHGIWLSSRLARRAGRGRQGRQPRLRHRPRGQVRARYDKIHLFDVDLPTGESWREFDVYSRRRGRGAGQRHAGRQARAHHLLRPALPAAVRAARRGRRRRDRGPRRLHRADRPGALACPASRAGDRGRAVRRRRRPGRPS